MWGQGGRRVRSRQGPSAGGWVLLPCRRPGRHPRWHIPQVFPVPLGTDLSTEELK